MKPYVVLNEFLEKRVKLLLLSQNNSLIGKLVKENKNSIVIEQPNWSGWENSITIAKEYIIAITIVKEL